MCIRRFACHYNASFDTVLAGPSTSLPSGACSQSQPADSQSSFVAGRITYTATPQTFCDRLMVEGSRMRDGGSADGMRSKFRVWWPKHLLYSRPPAPGLLLFGWFVSASSSFSSVDVVVAFALEESSLVRYRSSAIEEAIQNVRKRMPVLLRDTSDFSILGQLVQDSFNVSGAAESRIVDGDAKKIFSHVACHQCDQRAHAEIKAQHSSHGCVNVDNSQAWKTQVYCQNCRWIQLVYEPYQSLYRGIGWLPKVHHLHWDGQIIWHCNLHVIMYETPTFGHHHFSLNISSSKWIEDISKHPQWVNGLSQRQRNLDLDTVTIAINSADSADRLFDTHLGLKRSYSHHPIVHRALKRTCHLLAGVFATLATLLYIVLQLFHNFARYGSKFWIFHALVRMFSNTRKNVELRFSQMLYWPIFLKQATFRSSTSVEYAEKAAMLDHSMSSSVAVDVILGNLVGFILLLKAELICKWIFFLASDITNDVLRTGCAWLMGIPAGFKLNTELAEVVGMFSLNAIQFWSTLWSFASCFCSFAIKAVALPGIFLGITIPVAIMMDVIAIAARHVSTLHWLMSILYSHQIQALTALWRLFRGRKWNPLRQRLDSYNYTVEQHIVGSLLFTPLLLLVPTTSVFYMFFAITNTTAVFMCVLMEVGISLIHATPYNKIFLRLLKPKRFPSGIWFEMICYRNASGDSSSSITLFKEMCPSCEVTTQNTAVDGSQTTFLISELQSNIQTLGQLTLPHYRNIFTRLRRAANPSSTYGILIGKRLPTLLDAELPSPMPWMSVSLGEYWLICYDSIRSYLE